MSIESVFGLALAVTWGVVLSWFDCRERRLPNWLTVGGACVALIWRFGYGGPVMLLDGLIAGLAAGAVMFLPFLMRGAGGGDVKMLFACGTITGLYGLMPLLLYMSISGVLFGIGMLIFGKLDGSRLKHVFLCVFDWRYDRKSAAVDLPAKESDSVRIPFSIPITVGMFMGLTTTLMGLAR